MDANSLTLSESLIPIASYFIHQFYVENLSTIKPVNHACNRKMMTHLSIIKKLCNIFSECNI